MTETEVSHSCGICGKNHISYITEIQPSPIVGFVSTVSLESPNIPKYFRYKCPVETDDKKWWGRLRIMITREVHEYVNARVERTELADE